MTLDELLGPSGIRVGGAPADLEEAVEDLVRASEGLAPLGEGAALEELARGEQGEIVRVNDAVVLLLVRSDSLREVRAGLRVAAEPFAVSGEGKDPPATARVVLLLATPRRTSALKETFVPRLVRALREEEPLTTILGADSPREIRSLDGLLGLELRERLLVEDALTPLTYRIYPDTPLDEVVDLMVRRSLHAVPVVGESLEVLGIISVGDVLAHLLPRRRQEEDGEGTASSAEALSARDVMTRTVMCVAEDQSLLEAGNLMVNRDVEQLPVVREGELIGFLTRYAILKRLYGG